MTSAATAATRNAAAGAVTPQPNAASDPVDSCITCGDVALPLSVVAIDADRELALCEAADGGRETVEIALVVPVEVGDELLVHAATAIAKL